MVQAPLVQLAALTWAGAPHALSQGIGQNQSTAQGHHDAIVLDALNPGLVVEIDPHLPLTALIIVPPAAGMPPTLTGDGPGETTPGAKP